MSSEDGVSSLNEPHAVLCRRVVERIGCEIERVDRYLGAAVEGYGDIQGCIAWDVVYVYISIMSNSIKMIDSQFPLLAGPTPIAPYIPLATVDVVRIYGTPVSNTADGYTAPVFDAPRVTGFTIVEVYTVIARTFTFQKYVPAASGISFV